MWTHSVTSAFCLEWWWWWWWWLPEWGSSTDGALCLRKDASGPLEAQLVLVTRSGVFSEKWEHQVHVPSSPRSAPHFSSGAGVCVSHDACGLTDGRRVEHRAAACCPPSGGGTAEQVMSWRRNRGVKVQTSSGWKVLVSCGNPTKCPASWKLCNQDTHIHTLQET